MRYSHIQLLGGSEAHVRWQTYFSPEPLSKRSRWWREASWDAVGLAEAAKIFHISELRQRRALEWCASGSMRGGQASQSS